MSVESVSWAQKGIASAIVQKFSKEGAEGADGKEKTDKKERTGKEKEPVAKSKVRVGAGSLLLTHRAYLWALCGLCARQQRRARRHETRRLR